MGPLVWQDVAYGDVLTYYFAMTFEHFALFEQTGGITTETEQAPLRPPPEIPIPAEIQVEPWLEIFSPSKFPEQQNVSNKYVNDNDYSIHMPRTRGKPPWEERNTRCSPWEAGYIPLFVMLVIHYLGGGRKAQGTPGVCQRWGVYIVSYEQVVLVPYHPRDIPTHYLG
jgi:hypothetical protein